MVLEEALGDIQEMTAQREQQELSLRMTFNVIPTESNKISLISCLERIKSLKFDFF